jgi:hypothetical protein
MKEVNNLIILICFLILLGSCQDSKDELKTTEKSVFLISLDGLRWQELYTGADSSLIGDTDYVDDTIELKNLFWDDEMESRRDKLLPFFWSEIESIGVLLGNRLYGSQVNVMNDQWFSYPGYNEILTGFADENITSNDKINNPNETVLEFVNRQPGFQNKVAAFASWDVFPFIINEDRSGVPVNAGFESTDPMDITEKEELLNILQDQIPRTWSTVRVDAFTHHYAMEYIKKNRPRLLYISYGETDDFAHDGRYDQYLKSTFRTDHFIKELWEMVNNDPYYAGNTSFLITTDHGRGTIPKDTWRGHGTSIEGADQIWIAAIGPGIKQIGESKKEQQLYQNQIAATVASLLDLNYENKVVIGGKLTDILKE